MEQAAAAKIKITPDMRLEDSIRMLQQVVTELAYQLPWIHQEHEGRAGDLARVIEEIQKTGFHLDALRRRWIVEDLGPAGKAIMEQR